MTQIWPGDNQIADEKIICDPRFLQKHSAIYLNFAPFQQNMFCEA